MVRPRPVASDSKLPNPRSGHGLAVFGSVLAGGAAWACCDTGGSGAGAGRGAAAGGAAAGGAAFASVAATSFSVNTCGGLVVIIVALSLSPSRKSLS